MFAKSLATVLPLMICIVGTALAQDIPLVLRVAGETAGPVVQFDVLVGDTVIGSSTIEDAGPISGGKAAAAHLSDFSYDVPRTVLGPGQSIRVVLTRAPDDPGDSDIFLAEAILGGKRIDAADMGLVDDAGAPVPSPLSAGMVAVWGKGWTASIPVPAALALTEVPGDAEATNDMADVELSEAGDTACSVKATINLTSFQHDQTALAGQDEAQLSELARLLDGQTCTLTITGYASTRGDADVNAEISRRRAAMVYAEMKRLNTDLTKASQSGAGETKQFGFDPADNRRVVVEVLP